METATISIERYEELLKTETRVNVAVERIINQKYISNEDILRVLGTPEALEEAVRIKEENLRHEKEWNEKNGFGVKENADV